MFKESSLLSLLQTDHAHSIAFVPVLKRGDLAAQLNVVVRPTRMAALQPSSVPPVLATRSRPYDPGSTNPMVEGVAAADMARLERLTSMVALNEGAGHCSRLL